MNITDYLKTLVSEGVSDIHFKVGRPPLRRINGTLTEAKASPLTPKDTENIALCILGSEESEKLKGPLEYDASFSIPGYSRFRVSIFKQRGTISIVMRIIPFNVPALDDLGLPPVVKQLAMLERGLILVTGATGSGKSSTLAGMINHMNENTANHIITIEDPIEFLHRDKKASINQREIGVDTPNYNGALKSALRQDPQVIFIGEMRDLETMEIALRAAETGHLVLSTLHTTDAKETVSRLIDVFPPHQQNQIRMQIAENLKAVISQRLLERADGKGRVVAPEIMIVNAAIRGFILKPYQSDQILENMSKGKDQYGMQTFDQVILEFVRQGLITIDEALKNATSPNDIKLKLSLA